MGMSSLAGAGIILPSYFAVDLDPLPWRHSLPSEVMLPGVYVVAEPIGDAPMAGTICTNWRHATGAPDLLCDHCGVRWT